MRRELVPKPATLGAINLVQATPIATAVGVDGIFNKHRLLDRLNPTGSGFTTCTATSGSGLRIAGTRTTTLRQRTDQCGFGEATQTTVLSEAVPGGTRASKFARPSASSAIPMSGLTRSASA